MHPLTQMKILLEVFQNFLIRRYQNINVTYDAGYYKMLWKK